jgi:hypothetical protein
VCRSSAKPHVRLAPSQLRGPETAAVCGRPTQEERQAVRELEWDCAPKFDLATRLLHAKAAATAEAERRQAATELSVGRTNECITY